MSRWWRRSKDAAPTTAVGTAAPEFSDVKIVRREPADVLAELSEAFSDRSSRSAPSRASDGADTESPPADDDDDDETAPHAKPAPIRIGGDDGLPDATYLDDEIDTGSDSAPVFIDDDGTGDAVLVQDATGPGMEPRIRQRRIGVRREAGRRRLRRTAVAVGVLVVVVAVLALLGSSLFAVDSVDVTGARRSDPDAISAVVDELVGQPVLRAGTDTIEHELEAIPYVETARVRAHFPNRATIEIREREPVATTQGADGRFRILDREGRVIDVIDGRPVAFVLVSGPTTLDLAAGQFADSGHAAAAAMVTKLTPDLRVRVVSMSVVPDGSDLRLVLSHAPGPDIEVRFGAAISDTDQIERLVRLQRVLDDDVAKPDSTVIDVSTVETTG